MPVGVYYPDAQGYSGVRVRAEFWTSSGGNFEQPVSVSFSTVGGRSVYDDEIVIGCSFRNTGIPVRCVKDKE
jgi:hypothetical protein